MSEARRIRRIEKRRAGKHLAALASLIELFYKFMEREPQPTEEGVRQNYKDLNHRWKAYCYKNELSKEARILFEQEISAIWELKKKEALTGEA